VNTVEIKFIYCLGLIFKDQNEKKKLPGVKNPGSSHSNKLHTCSSICASNCNLLQPHFLKGQSHEKVGEIRV
jgi:hypothetical protein